MEPALLLWLDDRLLVYFFWTWGAMFAETLEPCLGDCELLPYTVNISLCVTDTHVCHFLFLLRFGNQPVFATQLYSARLDRPSVGARLDRVEELEPNAGGRDLALVSGPPLQHGHVLVHARLASGAGIA